MCLYEEGDGKVWVGTDGGGVFVLKDEKIILTLTKEKGLAGNVIFKISPLRKNEVWICTGSGASCIKNGKIYSFDSANGFGTDGIFQLLLDYTQKVWGTSNSGLFNITLDDIDAIMDVNYKAPVVLVQRLLKKKRIVTIIWLFQKHFLHLSPIMFKFVTSLRKLALSSSTNNQKTSKRKHYTELITNQ